ncbi:hypothetical protein [Microbispora sp. NBRC 16548]|uniref:hypothetical protein n=1 Tax=Microbispora sp. NBRC 16548 TaxID=3030994 RepID=UPI0024A23A74|nr:hypothetical protein [Microbispora sp. NBRC 16548]GLX06681.1 hypothetical protein Misp03_36080 [Microbispora sp. NBRC 16548]
MTTTPATRPVKVDDLIRARDGQYLVLRVRENGGLLKARHVATGKTWHLVPRNGVWTRL